MMLHMLSFHNLHTCQPFLSFHWHAIKCMANPWRVKMVAKQITRELSPVVLTDKVLQFAVSPEAISGAGRYLSSLTTITISDVGVSADLQVVKVYVSVFGDDKREGHWNCWIEVKAKYAGMKLLLTPEIRFIEDESLERGSRVIAILDRIKAEKEISESRIGEQPESADLPEDDKDWEGDNVDEDIIYVK
ncbi:probable ribosome-binding factor A, chloroplastic [Mangifera indica]|uniref:probable ribosome-binding factor A, chloroplastic n=1 Tax=Mangifera indica TaxID=29780 RepID=UPI001CFBACCE|nr:probable ribosome-binding factor A, chloroplastic [Mangifera indica]